MAEVEMALEAETLKKKKKENGKNKRSLAGPYSFAFCSVLIREI
jgi:hypothetical protein